MKRIFDITFAITIFLPSMFIILVCMILIYLTSRGSPLFHQVRIGYNEKPFVCYTLRTMHIDTVDAPSHETRASAVTPLGAVLRRFKLDELPQLWNILRGEMSFVGPRPCLPSQTALIAARRARGLHLVRPGITGVSQVAGIDMSEPERLAASDAAYLTEMGLITDLRLISATALGAGRGDRVRQ